MARGPHRRRRQWCGLVGSGRPSRRSGCLTIAPVVRSDAVRSRTLYGPGRVMRVRSALARGDRRARRSTTSELPEATAVDEDLVGDAELSHVVVLQSVGTNTTSVRQAARRARGLQHVKPARLTTHRSG
jgi:hypothetical protein